METPAMLGVSVDWEHAAKYADCQNNSAFNLNSEIRAANAFNK
jgi:hypothetical protein